MTIPELMEQFYSCNYPSTYEVDALTYARACQYIFDHCIENQTIVQTAGFQVFWISVSIGNHNGIFFKNVELILKEKE